MKLSIIVPCYNEEKNIPLILEKFNSVIKNEKIRRDLIREFEKWLKSQGFIIVKKRDNDFTGRNGNLERFYYLKLATKY